jgi:AcrR family transcriptional regulator
MPRTVDHDERRAALVEVTAQHIAGVGLDGVRLRDVARAAGWTTGAVSHYFPDKRTLLLTTFRTRTEMASRRVDRAMAVGSQVLQACVESFLPLDAEQTLTWRVWLAFWGAAVGDTDLAEEQQLRQRLFTDRLANTVRLGQSLGEVRSDIDVDETARYLAALIDGVSIQAVFDSNAWTPAEQRRFARRQMAALYDR